MSDAETLKQDLLEVCRRMYARGFIAATDGNVSVRLDENRIIFTPSGVCKGYIDSEDLIITDSRGNLIKGKGKPTTEIFMHLAAYRQRPDIKAVVHAHPPTTVAFTYANIPLDHYLLPEVIVTLGSLPLALYKTTGTQELAESISGFIKNFDAVILDKHGVITVGTDVFDAYYKLEKIEHNAQVIYMAKQLGAVSGLTVEQVEELLKLRNKNSNP